jgi:hypothetical protein
MDYIWIAVIVGTVLGLLASAIFGIYSKTTADSYSRMIFGISSYDFVFDGLILILIPSFMILTTLSFMIRDLWYPINFPGNFTIETLLMGFLPAFVFLLMPLFRGYTYTRETIFEFVILVVKFGLLHVLLQFSGFYSSIFPPLQQNQSVVN